MKGLFLDNFYKTINGMKIFGVLVLIMGFVVLFTGNSTALELFVYSSITALSVTAVSSMRKDADAKWDKFELTLPVTRKEIIKSKYISYLFWLLVGTVVAGVFTGLAVLIHGNVFFVFGFQDIASLFTLGMSIALLAGALFFLLVYILGTDKSETLLIVSVICGVALSIFFIWVVNRPLIAQIGNYYIRLCIFLGMSLILFMVSYIVTNIIYSKKEF